MPLDVGQILVSPPGIPELELSETEDSLWNELPYKEEQAKPSLPPIGYQEHQSWRLHRMYHGLIVLHLHCLIDYLHTMRISKNRLRFATTTEQVHFIC